MRTIRSSAAPVTTRVRITGTYDFPPDRSWLAGREEVFQLVGDGTVRIIALKELRAEGVGEKVWRRARDDTPSPSAGGSTPGDAVYAAATDAHRLIVSIGPTRMSGDRHSSTVEAELDGKVYRGCGDALPR